MGNQLRLSLFTVPDLAIGRAPLTPQNSQFDPKRVEYLEGMVEYLNGLSKDLRNHHSREEARSRLEKMLPQLPYSELATIATNGKLAATLNSNASGRIVFKARKSTRLNSSHLVISYAVLCRR